MVRVLLIAYPTLKSNPHTVNFVDLDPKEEYFEEMLASTKELKEYQISEEVNLPRGSKRNEIMKLVTRSNIEAD